MASVQKVTRRRKDGSTYARYRTTWRDETGKQQTKTYKRKGDADRKATEVEASLLTGSYVDPRDRTSFRAYAEQWRSVQQHRPGTAALYERVLRLHVYPVLGNRPLSTVTHTVAQAFVTSLSRGGLAPNTARQAHAITRTIFRSAVADRKINRTPFEQIPLPKVIRNRGHVPHTMDQVHRLAQAAPSALGALIVLGIATGLRSGELLGLTTDRVNFLRREVRIDRQMVYVPGHPPYLGPPKSEESDRTVPVPQFALDMLAAYLHDSPAEPCLVPVGAPDADPESVPLIFRADKGGPILRTTLDGRMRWLNKRVGMDPRVKPHDLRHDYATLLSDGGIPERAIQQYLGHAPQTVTFRVYTHVGPEIDDRARVVLTDAWQAAQATSEQARLAQ
jgi:integrase